MQVRVVTMRYQEGLQGFPEEVLQKVTFGKTVLAASEPESPNRGTNMQHPGRPVAKAIAAPEPSSKTIAERQ